MTVSAAFQGLGKTYPGLFGAVTDNALFAGLVFTLPALFGWSFSAVWWIKLTTAGIEMVIVALWLKSEVMRVRAYFAFNLQPARVRGSEL